MACQIYGYSPEELAWLNVTDLEMADQHTNMAQRLSQIRQAGEIRFETTHRRRNGTVLHVDVNGRLIHYGSQLAILSVMRDITERKLIEETLRRSEANLAEAQRIAHFGSWTWDLVTGKLQCSDEMFRLVGLRPQEVEVTQEVFLKFLPLDDAGGMLQRIQRLRVGEPADGLEHRLIRSDGEMRTVYSRVKVYRDEQGNPLRLFGSTQDITDRKQAEQALQRYSEGQTALYKIALTLNAQLDVQPLLRSIVEQAAGLLSAAGSAVYLYDDQRDILLLAVGWGFYAEDVGVELHPGESLPGRAFQQRTVMMLDDYHAWEGRAEAFRHENKVVSMIAAPLLGKRVPLGVLFLAGDQRMRQFDDHDAQLVELLTMQAASALENAQLHEQQQEQYRNLRDAQAQLIQAEKMAALGRLIASISHEINNPLQAVQGCLTLVREDLEEEALRLHGAAATRWRQDLDVAANEVQRIAGIVQRLRDFYRPARSGLQSMNIAATINSVLVLTAKQLQDSHITVEQTTAAQPPITITTNGDQLKQVLLNLVLNAIDAMPGKGKLRIVATLDTRRLDDRLQPVARIDVTDNGHGISPENLNRIFEPFFTTKEHGSGLGLSISYELIRALDGDLTVVSELGVGTTFTIFLPYGTDHQIVNAS